MVPVQNITDQDHVSRLLLEPKLISSYRNIIWDNVFQFRKNDEEGALPGAILPESLVWRKYAETDADVHVIGQRLEAKQKKDGKYLTSYSCFITSVVGDIRMIKTARGHGFRVAHEPLEGEDEHTHIYYAPAANMELKKGDKSDLKMSLQKVFSTPVYIKP